MEFCVKDIGAQYDLHVRKRDDLVKVIRIKAAGVLVDLTGSQFKAQVKRRANDSEVLADIGITVTGVGELTLDLEAVALACGEEGTEPLSRYKWDLSWIDAAGRKRTPLYGGFYVWAKVTEAIV